MSQRAVAEALVERITSALVEACLSWGKAINDAEAVKDKPEEHARRVELARAHGLEVANLSAAIAEKLRP